MTSIKINWNTTDNTNGYIIKTDGSTSGSGSSIFIDIAPNMKASINANPNMDPESFCEMSYSQFATLRLIISGMSSDTIVDTSSPNSLFELAVNLIQSK